MRRLLPILPTVLLIVSCAKVDVLRLNSDPLPPIDAAAVTTTTLEPKAGCVEVARMEVPAGNQRSAQRRLVAKAAEIGANTIWLNGSRALPPGHDYSAKYIATAFRCDV